MPIRADSACRQRWSTFEPRPGGRHCSSCEVTVVDLSRLTRRRAEALVIAAGGQMCARLRVDRDGEPVFRPETARAPGLVGVAALGLLAAACEAPSTVEPAAAAPDARPVPSLLDATSTGHFGGSLMRTEHTPMRPLGEVASAPTATPRALIEPAPLVALDPAEPTAEQLALTEAKVAREDRRARRRRSRAATASVAPGTLVHPLPPIGGSSPGNVAPTPTYLYLGGISYTP